MLSIEQDRRGTAREPLPPDAAHTPRPRKCASDPRQAAVGLGLALAIASGWLAIHVSMLFFVRLAGSALLLAPVLVALQCWLSVGLFIVAHDAMHGSLAPFRPRLNRAAGRIALMLYAGIWYDGLLRRHMAHHRAPGTDEDPDFSRDGRGGFWPWYAAFFTEYLSWGQVLRLGCLVDVYLVFGHVAPERLLLFWALPALLSSVQLFWFGTYLPHRRGEAEFADNHRTRSNGYPYLWSLLTCFHFGYHHEHHLDPSIPWWRLPARRRGRSAAA